MLFKIIRNSCLFLLIAICLVEGTIFFSPFKKFDHENDFAASIIDKQKLLKNTKSPKIVIVGGSSVAYGIDTKKMQDSLGVNVINMSFQYFLGSDFLIKQVQDELKKGDVLITSFEYISTVDGDLKEQFRAASYYSKAYNWINYSSLTKTISGFLRFRIDKFRSVITRLFTPIKSIATIEDTENIFFRKALNKNGDLISHLNNKKTAFSNGILLKGDTTFVELIPNLNLHHAYFKNKGVKMLFSYPPFNQSSYQLDSSQINKIEVNFSKKMNVELLDKPNENVFPDRYFLDMCFHLNKEGREVRTQKLIQELKKYSKRNAL